MANLSAVRAWPTLRWPRVSPLSSVRGRIITGFALLIIILAGVVAGSAWLQREHRSDLAAFEQHTATASLFREAEVTGEDLVSLFRLYVATGDPSIIPSILERGTAVADSLVQTQANMEAAGRTEDAAMVDEIITGAIPLIAETGTQIIARRRAGDIEGATAVLNEALVQVDDLRTRFGDFATLELLAAADLRARANRTGDLAFWLLIFSGAIGAALGLAASYLIARSILQPLSSLERTALAVAAHDAEARAPATGPRELAHLGETLNATLDTLQQRGKDLRVSNELLRDRTEELDLSNEELRQRNRELLDARAQAATDALTGLWNHRTFQERIRDEVARAQENSYVVGLVMLDIDDFKRINDSLGHLAGDQILRELSLNLGDVVKPTDLYRYGGDEFAILLPGADRRKTSAVAEQVRRAIERRTGSNGNRITISLGVASFPETAGSAQELIYGADSAMYWAKCAGKNHVSDWNGMLDPKGEGTTSWSSPDRRVAAPDIVTALVASLAAKDPLTGAHSERCSHYASRLAEEVGLDEKDTSIVRLASLLHDVGKLAVPDEVLTKPGPLTEEEWVQMRQHPATALEVLTQIRAISDATPAILHHHEHFDGSGYPDSLAGEDIPIASRILLVTDAFDAMTTDRPYRKAMPVESAIEELKRKAGSQFDPTIVEAFARIVSRSGSQLMRSTATEKREQEAAGSLGADPERSLSAE